MGYKREIYLKAIAIKNERIKKAKQRYEAQLSALRETDKQFVSLEAALMKAGSGITLAVFSGDNEKLKELQAECDTLGAKKAAILKKAGIEKPKTECRRCDDSGFVSDGYCDCIKEIAQKLVFDELEKSMPLKDCSFDNYDINLFSDRPTAEGVVPRKKAKTLLELCRQFAEEFSTDSPSLLFIGDTGLGKTHLSLSIVSAVSAKGFEVVYGSAQNLFSAAEKEHFSYNGDRSVEDSLLSCDLLVIDDLGTEFYSSYISTLLYNIINTRILNKKPTVINTNLDFDGLEKRYGERIVSRFIGNYKMKKFVGDDIRQIKALK